MPQTIRGVMNEFKEKQLHSGSSKGKVVTNPKQALAIGISEQNKLKGAPKDSHQDGEILDDKTSKRPMNAGKGSSPQLRRVSMPRVVPKMPNVRASSDFKNLMGALKRRG